MNATKTNQNVEVTQKTTNTITISGMVFAISLSSFGIFLTYNNKDELATYRLGAMEKTLVSVVKSVDALSKIIVNSDNFQWEMNDKMVEYEKRIAELEKKK